MTSNSALDLVRMAVRMRNAQKLYFRSRTQYDLLKSKELERDFDKKAEEYLNWAGEEKNGG